MSAVGQHRAGGDAPATNDGLASQGLLPKMSCLITKPHVGIPCALTIPGFCCYAETAQR